METFANTPITMTRNLSVKRARAAKADLLLMLDSDQDFDFHANEPWYKPFFPEAFTFMYDNYDRGPHVVGAPYVGSANAGNNCFQFYWETIGEQQGETSFRLEQYPRQIAAQMSGIQPCGALPTGMCMFDMRIFDLLDTNRKSKAQVLEDFKDGRIDKREALRCIQDGYFYYEWTDATASEKASTEDVAATRDMSLVGQLKLGYNPVHCAWDSWIGHAKPATHGRPKIFCAEQVGGVLNRAILDDRSYRDRIVRIRNDELLAALETTNGRAP